MLQLCRKRPMALHLSAMARAEPAHYSFVPATFCVPGDEAALLEDAAARGRKQAYIIKPDAGCQVGGAAERMDGAEDGDRVCT